MLAACAAVPAAACKSPLHFAAASWQRLLAGLALLLMQHWYLQQFAVATADACRLGVMPAIAPAVLAAADAAAACFAGVIPTAVPAAAAAAPADTVCCAAVKLRYDAVDVA